LAVAALFVLAIMVGGRYSSLFGGYARFEQGNYAPAVMIALGRGFVNPEWRSVPGLTEFLNLETRTLAITAADLPDTLQTRPLEQTHLRWRYCLHVVGWIWRYAGVISWDAITPLYAALYGLVAVFSYLAFRLLVGWPLALVGTLLIIFSPTNLYFLPHLRDYSKAPPIIAAVCAAGYLVKHGTSRTKTIGTCLALGSFLGLMMGFRKDVLICVWPTIAVLFLFLPGGLRRRLWEKALAALLLLATFFATSWPLWAGMEEQGSSSGHVLIYGLLPPFDDFLGVGGVDYELAPASNDAITSDIAGGYAERNAADLDNDPLRIYTPRYDEACNAFLRQYVSTFPADIIMRWYAAVLSKMRYGVFVASHESRYGPVRVPMIEHLFALRFDWLHGMSRLQVPLLLFCFLTLSGIAVRYGLAFALVVIYYCGYTSLQYDLRHHFHLEFLWWLPLLFTCHAMVRVAPALAGVRRSSSTAGRGMRILGTLRRPEALRMALSAVVLGVALTVPLVAARAYQHHAYADLFSRYAASPLRRLETETTTGADPRVMRIGIAETPEEAQPASERPKWLMRQRLLVAEFGRGQDVPIGLYTKEAKTGLPTLSYRCLVRGDGPRDPGDSLRYFLPVYESKTWQRYRYSEFNGFELWKSQEHQWKGLYEVTGAESIPLWFMMTMADDWTSRRRYKVLRNEMRPLHFRAMKATKHNLLANGGFEDWADGAPMGFTHGGPSFTIQPEAEHVLAGHAAVRQEWLIDGSGGSASTPFGCFVRGLEPATIYEVIVSARNPSASNILLSAWDLPTTESGSIDFSRPPTRLRQPVLRVVPCDEFSTYWGTFTTAPTPDPIVYLCIERWAPAYPAVVFWDEWRVHKWPGQRESWDFNLWINVQAK